MEINLVCVGQLKEDYWKKAIDEYKKRLSAFCDLNIYEVRGADNVSAGGDIQRQKEIESENLNKYKKGHCIALEIGGKDFTSEGFADYISKLTLGRISTISFFIGGSNGMDRNFVNGCDLKLSFSKFTFPHQMMRVVLLEQIYRIFCINNGKAYHK